MCVCASLCEGVCVCGGGVETGEGEFDAVWFVTECYIWRAGFFLTTFRYGFKAVHTHANVVEFECNSLCVSELYTAAVVIAYTRSGCVCVYMMVCAQFKNILEHF